MKKINLSFLSGFSEKFFASDAIVRPKRDWAILLFLFFIMLAGSVAFDAFLYRDVTSGEMYVSVNVGELGAESINTAMLSAAVNDFDAKKLSTSELKMQKLIDPSL